MPVEGLITYVPPLQNVPPPRTLLLPRLGKGIIFCSAPRTKSLGINHSFYPFPHSFYPAPLAKPEVNSIRFN